MPFSVTHTGLFSSHAVLIAHGLFELCFFVFYLAGNLKFKKKSVELCSTGTHFRAGIVHFCFKEKAPDRIQVTLPCPVLGFLKHLN